MLTLNKFRVKINTLNLICAANVIFFVIPYISAEKLQTDQPSQVERLLEGLKHEEWRDDEEHCKASTLEWLYGVKNQSVWATWIWDSMQMPAAVLYGSRFHLGSFEQCLSDPWSVQKSQYCLVDIQLAETTRAFEKVDPRSSVKDFVKIKIEHARRSINSYSQGVCLPAVCSPSSVARISQQIHQLSYLSFGNVSVEARNCQVKESQTEYSLGFYVFWLIIIITSSIATIAYFKEETIENPKLKQIVKWFSPTKNFNDLTKTSDDEVVSLNGIRCICAGATVIMHTYYVFIPIMINHYDMGKQSVTTLGYFFIQFPLLVESYFLLSGILHMKGMLTNRSGLIKLIWKRYIRFMVPIALILLYMSSVLPHTVSGPLWPRMMAEQVNMCIRNQWSTLLMVNNFVASDEICPFFAWHLSCDLQLTIFGTILYWLCQRRRNKFGLCVMLFVISLIIPAAWTYWKKLPPILAYDLETSIYHTQNIIYLTTYVKPYSRASSYLIGLGLGYVMQMWKPQNYRNCISKTWSMIGFVLAFAIMVLLGVIGGSLVARDYDVYNIVAYSIIDKSGIALSMSLLIVVLEYGNIKFMKDMLRIPAVFLLSRLTFGLSLYHPVFLWQNFYSLRAPLSFEFTHLLLNGFGYIFIGLVFSFLFWFIVEAPLVNITNSLFKRDGEKKVSASYISKKNGVLCDKNRESMKEM